MRQWCSCLWNRNGENYGLFVLLVAEKTRSRTGRDCRISVMPNTLVVIGEKGFLQPLGHARRPNTKGIRTFGYEISVLEIRPYVARPLGDVILAVWLTMEKTSERAAALVSQFWRAEGSQFIGLCKSSREVGCCYSVIIATEESSEGFRL